MNGRPCDDWRDFSGQAARHDHTAGLAVQALTSGLLARLPATVWQSGPADEDVARVLAFIHDRPARPIDNAELARVAAVSVNTFLRRFRRFTGTTPHQYLTQVRLANAIAALLTTEKSIDQIAADSGFCDRYHLSRIFQRNVYVGPATFRKTARERRTA
ncbi:MAG: AraC family transcriptional regulator [Tepidisphaeraceae bacterium]